jgi:hypothetical protein
MIPPAVTPKVSESTKLKIIPRPILISTIMPVF